MVNTSEDTICDTKVGLSLAEGQQSGSHSMTAHLVNRSQSSLTHLPPATVFYTSQSQKAFVLQLASPDEQLEHLSHFANQKPGHQFPVVSPHVQSGAQFMRDTSASVCLHTMKGWSYFVAHFADGSWTISDASGL